MVGVADTRQQLAMFEEPADFGEDDSSGSPAGYAIYPTGNPVIRACHQNG
jgi:hypothetical protein